MRDDDCILTRTPLGDYVVRSGGGRPASWEVRGMGLRLRFAKKREAQDSLAVLRRRLPDGNWTLFPDVDFRLV